MKFKKVKFYILSILIKIIILIIITSIISIFLTSGTTANDIAINQFENDDGAYLELESYNKNAQIISWVNYGMSIFIGLAVLYDVYKIINIFYNDDDLI